MFHTAQSISSSRFAGKSFLIVDDFLGMRAMVRDMLCTFGAQTIDTAANAEDAMARLAGGRYDVVLCDYNLGAGKNGLQVLEEVKHRNLTGLTTAWIIVTAEKTSELVYGAAEHMPDDYIIKPISEATMRVRLEKVLAKKAALADIEQAVRGKDHALVIALCDGLLEDSPLNRSELLRIKTSTLMTLGLYDQAEQVYREILERRDVPWARTGLGKVALCRGDAARAQQLLGEVVRDNPAYLEARDWLARACENVGDLDEAQRVLARSVELSPSAVGRQRALGEVAQKRGDLKVAEAAFRKAIALAERSIHKSPSAYFSLARICADSGNLHEALQVLKCAGREFEAAEVHLNVKILEGRIYAQSGDTRNAARISHELAAAMTATRSLPATSLLEATEWLLANGSREIADEAARMLVSNHHEDAGLLIHLGDLYDRAGCREEGEALISRARQEVVESNNRAVMLAQGGELNEAIRMLTEAREQLPDNKRIAINLANVVVLAMHQQGVSDERMRLARDCVAQVARLSPGEKWCDQVQASLDGLAG